ncbi:hypothetical protein CLU86_0622 [Acidovorax sp. 62]|uniref:hypothetical protein n=1 Tax=Acidovorax sp. 62 TaxID=2035203 RepID=UPI000C199D4C|nr:hypothetical protein [Acidovorax sp. 62]PIF89745.1 hypothetical protein CLU86_0622 [Acidovorax sp. 62]
MQAHYYAQVSAASIVFAVTQVAAEIEAPDMVPIESLDASLIGQRWNPAAQAFEPGPPPAETTERNVSRKAFLSRFTDAEAIDIDLASIGATREAATVRRYLSKVNAAQHIDLADDETRTGVQALEAAGLLQPGRALAILDAPIEPKELP